jgi:hypothetical protein
MCGFELARGCPPGFAMARTPALLHVAVQLHNIRFCSRGHPSSATGTTAPNGGYFLTLQPGDPHVSLPTLALESADATGVAPEKSLGSYSP